jgi:hypothetical protein
MRFPARLRHSGGLALLGMTALLWCLLLAGAGFEALPQTQPLPTASPYLTRCHSERNKMKRKNLILKNIFTGQRCTQIYILKNSGKTIFRQIDDRITRPDFSPQFSFYKNICQNKREIKKE